MVAITTVVLPYNCDYLVDIYDFEGKESIADISTELQCLGKLENPCQLRFNGYSEVLVIVSYRFPQFFQYYVFEIKESIANIPT